MFNAGGSHAGAEHWLWSGGTKIQFGTWNGDQLHDGTGVTNHTSMAWFSTTWDGTTYKLYVNGVLKHQRKHKGFRIMSNAVTLGHPHIGEHGFTGCVDKMYMCRKAETAKEVADFVKKVAAASGEWVKGPNGKTCDSVCKGKGKTCDVSELNKLTTNEKVGAAFKQAGYTCKGYHAKRSYPGTPFSTGRGDDCAPVIPGKSVTCSGNSHGHHAALCYCKGAAPAPAP